MLAKLEPGDDMEAFERPAWLGDVVTDDSHSYSGYLAKDRLA